MTNAQPSQTSQLFDDVQKKQIEAKLTNVMIDDFAANRLSQQDMRDAANVILDEMPQVKTFDEVMSLLTDLKSVWPLFEKVYIDYKGVTVKFKEKQIIDKLSNYIKNIN